MNRVPLYVINNFLKFDRKIYQLFGLKLGRPLRLKSILYFFIFAGVEAVWYITPVIGLPIRVLPFSVLFIMPAICAYLLTDIGTEGRMPAAYFRSFVSYHVRQLKKVSYVRGKEIGKPIKFQVNGHAKVKTEKMYNKEQKYKMKGYATASCRLGKERSLLNEKYT